MLNRDTIYNENCLATMAKMDEGMVDFILTSPPYDDLRDYEGDLVYDPFMGSGTTAKMAILNKRHYIGSEISSNYCDIANKRVPWIML